MTTEKMREILRRDAEAAMKAEELLMSVFIFECLDTEDKATLYDVPNVPAWKNIENFLIKRGWIKKGQCK